MPGVRTVVLVAAIVALAVAGTAIGGARATFNARTANPANTVGTSASFPP